MAAPTGRSRQCDDAEPHFFFSKISPPEADSRPHDATNTRSAAGAAILKKMLPEITLIRLANLSLLVLYPLSWFAPLLRAGFLPLFGLNEISVISGLQSLWKTDALLALLVAFFAILAPYAKTIGLALIHFGLLGHKVLPTLTFLGKLAMADIFLIALYIVVIKGIGVGKVETAWGLYLFTGCILASIIISFRTQRR